MEWRGNVVIHNRINSRWYAEARTLVIAFLVILFFVVDAGAACRSSSEGYSQRVTSLFPSGNSSGWWCYRGSCNNPNVPACNTASICSLQKVYLGYPNYYWITDCDGCSDFQNYYTCSGVGHNDNVLLRCRLRCDSERDADSAYCDVKGYSWDSATGECNEPLDESVCDYYRQGCADLGGRFSGHAIKVDGQTCCSGECNLCGKSNMQRIKDLKTQECCNQLLAPPPDIKMCYTPVQDAATCGITLSRFADGTNGEWACQDPSLDSLVQQRYYEECASLGSSASAGSSGSEGGSSEGGSAGGSSVSPYPEGCDECPWLDSILDTLTLQKEKVDQIYLCLTVPQLCSKDGTEEIAIDTSLLPYLRPFMDSSLGLDSSQLKALQHLDTNILKMLANDSNLLKIDSAMLQSDSATRKTIMGGVSTLDSTIDASSDSTKKWLRRLVDSSTVHSDSNMKYLKAVADSIGITADSLKAHLDSIMNRIPSDILDSILKYQKENAEKEDSVVIGSLDQLDSILDSTIVYWKKAQTADSVRHAERNDSTEAIHKAIEDISVRIGYIMGYGDTASTNLRGDIEGIRDSAVKYWRQTLQNDSAYSLQFGEGITAVQGSIQGVGISVDSVVGRLGSLENVLGDINGKLGEGSYDTSTIYDGYLSGYDTSAVKFVSDVGEAVSGAMNDTTYRGIFVQGSASSSEIDGYALPNLDSAHQVLKASVDSTYNALGTDLEGKFDTLKKEFVLINWDSAIVAPLGMKVPNTNTCPEDCFVIDLSSAGPIFSSLNSLSWGVCKPWSVLAGLNVLEFVRLILRIVTAVTCVTLGMWFIAGRRN